jgi:hypothetical protein
MQLLVNRVAGKLPKTGLMNKASRLTLVKSVLGAIPIHQLPVFAPAKTIKLI